MKSPVKFQQICMAGNQFYTITALDVNGYIWTYDERGWTRVKPPEEEVTFSGIPVEPVRKAKTDSPRQDNKNT